MAQIQQNLLRNFNPFEEWADFEAGNYSLFGNCEGQMNNQIAVEILLKTFDFLLVDYHWAVDAVKLSRRNYAFKLFHCFGNAVFFVLKIINNDYRLLHPMILI
jgi:hypothetical protein